jgi:YHS domain-containing protein
MTAILFLALLAPVADPVPKSPREAFQPLNPLIGAWKGTGQPDGTREERQKGFWSESIDWCWQFKGDDAWLVVAFEKGKHYRRGELRYLPGGIYQLTLQTSTGQSLVYTGTLTTGKQQQPILTLERTDDPGGRVERFVLTLLHSNRHLYRLDSRSKSATSFSRQFQVGATKEGVPFASVPAGPECIVSGGKGTIAVSHGGKTYYVCCSGCRDAFNENPEPFIQAAAKKK